MTKEKERNLSPNSPSVAAAPTPKLSLGRKPEISDIIRLLEHIDRANQKEIQQWVKLGWDINAYCDSNELKKFDKPAFLLARLFVNREKEGVHTSGNFDSRGLPPLHYAILLCSRPYLAERSSALKFELGAGAAGGKAEADIKRPEVDRIKVVEFLLGCNANPNLAPEPLRKTALHMIADLCNHGIAPKDIAKLITVICEKGLDFTLKDATGKTAIESVLTDSSLATKAVVAFCSTLMEYQPAAVEIMKYICPELLKELENSHKGTLARTWNKTTLLHLAAQAGNYQAANFLIGQNKNTILATDDEGNTALHLACKYDTPGNQQVAVLLAQQSPECLTKTNNYNMIPQQLIPGSKEGEKLSVQLKNEAQRHASFVVKDTAVVKLERANKLQQDFKKQVDSAVKNEVSAASPDLKKKIEEAVKKAEASLSQKGFKDPFDDNEYEALQKLKESSLSEENKVRKVAYEELRAEVRRDIEEAVGPAVQLLDKRTKALEQLIEQYYQGLLDVTQDLNQLSILQDQLLKPYRDKEAIRGEQRRLDHPRSLKVVYFALWTMLDAKFYASLVLHSDLVEASREWHEKLGKFFGAILSDAVPFVGGTLGFFIEEGANLAIDSAKQEKIRTVMYSLTPENRHELPELTARCVALQLLKDNFSFSRIDDSMANKAGEIMAQAIYKLFAKGEIRKDGPTFKTLRDAVTTRLVPVAIEAFKKELPAPAPMLTGAYSPASVSSASSTNSASASPSPIASPAAKDEMKKLREELDGEKGKLEKFRITFQEEIETLKQNYQQVAADSQKEIKQLRNRNNDLKEKIKELEQAKDLPSWQERQKHERQQAKGSKKEKKS